MLVVAMFVISYSSSSSSISTIYIQLYGTWSLLLVFAFVVIAQLYLRFHHHLFRLFRLFVLMFFILFIKCSIDHGDIFAIPCATFFYFVCLFASSAPVNLAERTKSRTKTNSYFHRTEKDIKPMPVKAHLHTYNSNGEQLQSLQCFD